ncbi:BnaA03g11870D [Brassica napus]|uniref:(rape) hypothetical protein n=1 Tax=Brassica napus TaxID=3708 RepID=A0A078HX61_BRANA|nr:unnamed protein product [Brassica napus]CDY43040.1 BnaA03g11870D [Brassica napus]
MVFITRPLVLLVLFLSCSALYTPPDNYLISCGSSQNITFQGRTFVPESLLLKTGNSSLRTGSKSHHRVDIGSVSTSHQSKTPRGT